MNTDLDRIERQIDIAAPASRVWTLISEPGWFINDGVIVEHQIDQNGDVSVVHDPVHGAFSFQTVELVEPRYAAFRWLGGDAGSTLVEFWIDERNDGSVSLRVAESGFSTLTVSEEERRRKIDDNTEGWETELAAARSYLTPSVREPATAERAAGRG
ncbi:SRPBCC family protein [Hoyosella subflava]|uniref:ATPase n=1 Tax=Hoyosella subflava (strain DSM 45089 / JCM 17490 / NBRC 109087 / DQS3-9A1) TaxID=443218 RepID=F6EKR6_HOYSD|nr:ATPase [Hoyosella subflava]AEF41396.1 hypothetical protein AS9A_2949 [Hoyosella subflava DQS3-9A1]